MRKKRKQHQQINIEGISSEGYGIARINDRVVFVDKAIPGDVVDIEETKRRKSYRYARILDIVRQSDHRNDPFCAHFGVCGGCKWQHIEYDQQATYKQQIVLDAMQRIGKIQVKQFMPIVSADPDKQYRNKLEYTFSSHRWLTQEEIDSNTDIDNRNALGFHVPGNYSRVVDIQTCWLQHSISNDIRNFVRSFAELHEFSFYNIIKQHGLLRNLVVRTTALNELMVIVIWGAQDETAQEMLKEALLDQFPQITSLHFILNTKRNDSYADLPVECVFGSPYIHETIGDYTFRIRPKSFFQTNSYQAQKLYQIIKDFAGLNRDDIVYDLYGGVGSIGIYLSSDVKKVVGIELVEQAVEDAKENAQLNNVSNASFHVGDVNVLMNDSFIRTNGMPNVVVTDPPRSGMHSDVIQTLLTVRPPKIVYVSCNPSTQARDLEQLSQAYDISKMQPVDMFPHTIHIENVALLERIKNT